MRTYIYIYIHIRVCIYIHTYIYIYLYLYHVYGGPLVAKMEFKAKQAAVVDREGQHHERSPGALVVLNQDLGDDRALHNIMLQGLTHKSSYKPWYCL